MRFTINKPDFNTAVNQTRDLLLKNGLKIVAEIPTSRIVNQAGYSVRPTTLWLRDLKD